MEPPKPTDTKKRSKPDTEERRQKKAAKKVAAYLAALGLDENGEPIDNYSLLQYPVREWKFTLPGTCDAVAMNPVVTLLAVATLGSFVLWAAVDPAAILKIVSWRDSVTLYFTWFYQFSKVLMFFFMMFVTYRYGHIHLGRKKDKPEYSNLTYFCMIFAANVGPSLLNSASDALYLDTDHYYATAGYRSQDELDMFSVNAVANNWGIGNWISITLVAVAMALSGFCFNAPMSFRSCFLPLLGVYTWGWMGDLIDTMAIVATLACTSDLLRSTAILCTSGLVNLGLIGDRTTDELVSIQSVVIWLITIVSTLSVLSGLRGGIQFIPLIAMSFGLTLTFLVLVMDDTKFLLNLTVQETGYFLQNGIFQLNFWTDAFGQLREGSGRAVDGKAAEPWWTGAWPIMYQAWATCLAPIIGVFVAYISRGRKLWEVVFYSFGAPLCAIVVWTTIWSGISLRQRRQALELFGLGEVMFNNSEHFLADGSEHCYDVPQDDLVVEGTVIFTNYLPGVTPVCMFDPDSSGMTVYNVFKSFRYADSFSGQQLSAILSSLYLLGCTLFYIAHSDACTFIMDTIASNGRKNYHWSRRMFWSGTTAILATALVSSTNDNVVDAASSFALLCGFPIAVLVCYLMQSVLLLCRAAEPLKSVTDSTEYLIPDEAVFAMPIFGGVFNVAEYLASLGRVNAARIELGMDLPTRVQLVEFGLGLVLPFYSLYTTLNAVYPLNTKANTATATGYGVCFIGWFILALSSRRGFAGVSVTLWVLSGLVLAMVRCNVRAKYHIRSNVVADIVGATLLWPQVLAQMRLLHQVQGINHEPSGCKNDDDGNDGNDCSEGSNV